MAITGKSDRRKGNRRQSTRRKEDIKIIKIKGERDKEQEVPVRHEAELAGLEGRGSRRAMGEDGDALTVLDAVLEGDWFAVRDDGRHLDVWDAGRLDHVLDRGRPANHAP